MRGKVEIHHQCDGFCVRTWEPAGHLRVLGSCTKDAQTSLRDAGRTPEVTKIAIHPVASGRLHKSTMGGCGSKETAVREAPTAPQINNAPKKTPKETIPPIRETEQPSKQADSADAMVRPSVVTFLLSTIGSRSALNDLGHLRRL